MKSIKDNLTVTETLAPAAHTATVHGTGVDLADQRENLVQINVGTITDGTHTPALEESSDNSTFTAVAAADMVGAFGNLASNVGQKVGYIGHLRYIRVTVTVAGATTGGVYGSQVITGGRKKPQ